MHQRQYNGSIALGGRPVKAYTVENLLIERVSIVDNPVLWYVEGRGVVEKCQVIHILCTAFHIVMYMLSTLINLEFHGFRAQTALRFPVNTLPNSRICAVLWATFR